MKTVDDFIQKMDSPELQETVHALRKVILQSVPGIEEKIRYGVPFYDYSGMLCYINVRQKQGEVDLGLCKGYLHKRHLDILDIKDRKQIRSLSFINKSEIHPETVIDIIQEAVSINSLSGPRRKQQKC